MSCSPLVVDLDLDFLVRGTGTLREEPNKPLWCSANRLVDQLRLTGLTGERVETFIDQQEALAVWDRLRIRDAVVVHLDAHRDVYAVQNGSVNEPLGVRGDVVGCGDYLFHALREGVVALALQVVPDFLKLELAARDILSSCPAAVAECLTLTRLDNLPAAVEALDLRGPPAVTTVAVSPAWFPPHAWPEADRLLELLGIETPARDRLYQEAVERWAAIEEGQVVKGYRFPYARAELP